MKTLKLTSFLFCLLIFSHFHLSGQWTQIGTDLNGLGAQDGLGTAIALSDDGTRLAVGSIQFSGTDEQPGYAQVFEWNGAEWIQMGANLNGAEPVDQFGTAISLNASGDRVAVGAPFNDDNGNDAGQVTVWEWKGTNWAPLGAAINGENSDEWFGFSLALSAGGNHLVVGSPSNGDNGFDSGQLRIFEWDGNRWEQLGADINGQMEGESLGSAVSISSAGTRVAAGAPFNPGTARVYEWNVNDWKQIGEDIVGEGTSDFFGQSISMANNGQRIAISAPGNSDNGDSAGKVYSYEFDGSNWVPYGQDLEGVAARDQFGQSVSLSQDGTRLAVGAPGNDERQVAAGQTRVFEWKDDQWVQIGQNINGERLISQSGLAVALSSSGERVAVGAPFNSDVEMDAGQVRVFEGFLVSTREVPKQAVKAKLFPNPATERTQLTVEVVDYSPEWILELWESRGQVLQAKQARSNNELLLSHLPPGVYEVVLRDPTTQAILLTKKLVVQH